MAPDNQQQQQQQKWGKKSNAVWIYYPVITEVRAESAKVQSCAVSKRIGQSKLSNVELKSISQKNYNQQYTLKSTSKFVM